MGVKIAKAMGHHVTVISSSNKKRQEAMADLWADEYLVSTDATKMQDATLLTVPVFHPLEPYLTLLKLDGKLIFLGSIDTPLQFVAPMILLGGKTITRSFIGSMKEMEERLEFCKEKGVTSIIQVVKMDYVNKARYRFVLDVAGSNLGE